MTITAVKPVYDRKARRYGVKVVEKADPILVHHGYLVYDDAANVLARIEAGDMLGHWKPAQVGAVVAYLKSVAGV